jgi:hypothetical protein
MHIVCTTASAAGEVLFLLLVAGLRPIRDFAIQPTFSITPPITFTMLIILTAAQMTKIRTVADTTIVG